MSPSRPDARAPDLAEPLVVAYRHAVLARTFEARVIQLSLAGEIAASLHPGAGHEVCQAAALAVLRDDDQVLYGHRGVAYMIARGMPLEVILADIAGREGGSNNGRGGVMHVVDPARGILGESGTLGGGFVIAAGVGMALQRFGRGQVVIHFFGDGTANRGTFHESLNWAAVRKLPVVFFCENNGWAVSVPTSVSTAVPDLSVRAAGYGIPGVTVEGDDPVAVVEVTRAAAARARSGQGPTLIEAKLTRLLGHYVGDPQAYRPDADAASAQDPLPRFRTLVQESGLLDAGELDAIDADCAAAVERAVAAVRDLPPASGATLAADLYA